MDLAVILTVVSVIVAVVALIIAYLTFRVQYPDHAKRALRISAIGLIAALILATIVLFVASPTRTR